MNVQMEFPPHGGSMDGAGMRLQTLRDAGWV
jgi:hypothetical protein